MTARAVLWLGWLSTAGCTLSTVHARNPSQLRPEDPRVFEVTGVRTHYRLMNRYADLRRLAERRAGDLRDNGKITTAVGAIVSLTGTATTGIAQIALDDEDAARNVTTAVGITVALAGGIVAVIAALTASTKEAGELDAAAATIDGALGEASTIEADLARASEVAQRTEETARSTAALTKRASSARTTILRNTQAGEVDELEQESDRATDRLLASMGAAGEVAILSLDGFFEQIVRERTTGYQPAGPPERGELAEHGNHVVQLPMQSGKCYRLLGAAQPAVNGVNDLDIVLRDSQSQTLGEDRDRNSRPLVDYCPPAQGIYFGQLEMYEGSGPFIFRVFVRDAPVPAPGSPSPQ